VCEQAIVYELVIDEIDLEEIEELLKEFKGEKEERDDESAN